MRKKLQARHIILFSLLAALAFAGCKKSSGGDDGAGGSGDYYVKFKFNGTQMEFKSLAMGQVSATASNGIYSAIFYAYKNYNASNTLLSSMSITLYSNAAITTNVSYHDPLKATPSSGSSIVPQILITYYDDKSTGFQSMGSFSDANGVITGSDLIPSLKTIVVDSKATITQINATSVKGTFSGTIYNVGTWTQGVKNLVTEGEFYVKKS